ncbi:MAG: zinc-binding dehydrogenase [Rhizobiales bacterium]|nr:zinc-binding dehydrogenase [Hyphomicrobiales bacterium]
MRAAYYESNGAARAVLRLGDVPTPQPGAGEVRVKVMASGVNPSDVKAREGRTRKIAYPRVIPHSDGAGVIDAVGDGVSKGRVGERVWIWNAQWKRAAGTCAEYAVLPEAMAVSLPGHVSFEAAACLGIPAMTAYQAVASAEAWAGSTLLVSAGAGGVGHYVSQFAKARGAVVIATVSSEAKAELARQAGADHTIDYRREDVGARVMDLTDNAGVDAVIEMDLSANAKLYPRVLRPRGTVVVYGTGTPESQIPSQWMLVNAITLKFIYVYELTLEERAAAIGEINRMLETKRLINNVAKTFPLSDIAAAHEAVEDGQVPGNVVVTIA